MNRKTAPQSKNEKSSTCLNPRSKWDVSKRITCLHEEKEEISRGFTGYEGAFEWGSLVLSLYKSQINSQGTQEDEVAKKCSSRWSRWDWQLTAAFHVGFHLDIVVSSACRVNCPLFNIVTRLISMYFCFLQMRRCRYCWIKYFVSPNSFPLATGSKTDFWLEVILTESIPQKWISGSERTNYIDFLALEVR